MAKADKALKRRKALAKDLNVQRNRPGRRTRKRATTKLIDGVHVLRLAHPFLVL